MKMGDRHLTADGHLDAVFQGRYDVPVRLTGGRNVKYFGRRGSIRSRFNPSLTIERLTRDLRKGELASSAIPCSSIRSPAHNVPPCEASRRPS